MCEYLCVYTQRHKSMHANFQLSHIWCLVVLYLPSAQCRSRVIACAQHKYLAHVPKYCGTYLVIIFYSTCDAAALGFGDV